MSEWLKEHAWKACVLQKGTVGSNPTLSANKSNESPHSGVFFMSEHVKHTFQSEAIKNKIRSDSFDFDFVLLQIFLQSLPEINYQHTIAK